MPEEVLGLGETADAKSAVQHHRTKIDEVGNGGSDIADGEEDPVGSLQQEQTKGKEHRPDEHVPSRGERIAVRKEIQYPVQHEAEEEAAGTTDDRSGRDTISGCNDSSGGHCGHDMEDDVQPRL